MAGHADPHPHVAVGDPVGALHDAPGLPRCARNDRSRNVGTRELRNELAYLATGDVSWGDNHILWVIRPAVDTILPSHHPGRDRLPPLAGILQRVTLDACLKIVTSAQRKTIYLANPYGFSEQQKTRLLPELIGALERLGLEVWEPFQRNNQVDISEPGWAHRIALADYGDVRNADAIFAVVNGTPPDEGVMVELGIAIALGKPTFLFRDDFRRVTDSEEYPLNLMLFAGLPKRGWQDYYYKSIAEITAPDKALARWARAEPEAGQQA